MVNYMSIVEDIAKVLSLPYSDVLNELNIQIVSNKCIYVTNFISILGYDSNKVILKVKNNVVVINGEDLKIKDIEIKSIIIIGKILNIEYSR